MLITAFTPVFNRRELIHRVWDGLCSQTCRDFEWIVIDDGSTDNVIELLNEYKERADFPVTVIRQENKGKHVAMNRAVEMARGELFTEIDSDDGIKSEAFEIIKKQWESLRSSERFDECGGIGCLTVDPISGNLYDKKFPDQNTFFRWLDLKYKHKIKGGKWWFIRTEFRQRYLLPETAGCSYFPESFFYSKISRIAAFFVLNIPLKDVYADAPFSLVRTPENNRNAEALYLSKLTQLNEEQDYILSTEGVVGFCRLMCSMWKFAFLSGRFSSVIPSLNPGVARLTGILCCPVGFLLYHIHLIRSY